MNDTDPASLNRLHDIWVPPPVPWWPPAPGWYLLIALVVVLLTLWIAHRVLRWRANAYRRAAITQLNTLTVDAIKTVGIEGRLRETAEILKRTALAAVPREEVAGLSGKSWIAWLNQHGGGTAFERDDARLLEHSVYRRDIATCVDVEQLDHLTDQVRAWVESHRITSSA